MFALYIHRATDSYTCVSVSSHAAKSAGKSYAPKKRASASVTSAAFLNYRHVHGNHWTITKLKSKIYPDRSPHKQKTPPMIKKTLGVHRELPPSLPPSPSASGTTRYQPPKSVPRGECLRVSIKKKHRFCFFKYDISMVETFIVVEIAAAKSA